MIEKLDDVRSPDKPRWVLSEKSLDTAERGIRAFTFAARPCVIHKPPVKDRHEIFVDQAVNDAISDRRDGNRSSLAIRDFEKTISARRIRVAVKIIVEV